MAVGLSFGNNISLPPVYFFAYRNTSNQVIGGAGTNKVQFNAELYDTGGYFDPVTNYRFTPLIKGLYYFYWSINLTAAGSYSALYKNGSNYARTAPNTSTHGYHGSVLMELNGSTDYVEIFVITGGADTIAFGTAPYLSYFEGFLVYSN